MKTLISSVNDAFTPVLRPQIWRLPTRTGVQLGWRLGGMAGEAGAAADGREPWLALHGGPGGGASPGLLAAFDGARHAVWGPHQRGCVAARTGRAARLPVAAMVDDLEALRLALGIARWSVLGGSWGAYLALAYVQRYPDAVTRVVLRGSFLAGADDVWGLVRAMPPEVLRRSGLPAPANRGQLTAWLTRVQRVLRFATPTPAQGQLTQAWLLAEYRCAVRGARRAVLNLPRAADGDALSTPSAPRLRATWRDLRRGERRAEVALRTRRPVSVAQLRKVTLQAQLLSRGCDHLLRGALPAWRAWLASASVQSSAPSSPRLLLLHGRFDAVCHPKNARRLQQALADLAQPPETQAVQVQWIHSGHLAHEPAMAQALRQAVRGRAS